MEMRKVQLSGGTTFTVSIPKSWATEHGIEAGSVLALHPKSDGSILIDAQANNDTLKRTVTVDVSTDSDAEICHRIHAAYTAGADSLVLVDQCGHPDDRRQLIERSLVGLSGFELLETTTTRISLQNLVETDNVDIRKTTLRLRLTALAMHRDAVTAVVEADDQLARRVVDRDTEADKLFAMVMRHFRRSLTDLNEVEKLNETRDKLFEYYYTARQLERIGDHAVKIAQFTLDPDARFPDEYESDFSELSRAAREVADNAADAILTDTGIAVSTAVLDDQHRVLERICDLDRDAYECDDPAEAYVLGLLLNSLRRTVECGANIAEVALEQLTRQTATP